MSRALTIVLVIEGSVSAAAAKVSERFAVRVETRALIVDLTRRQSPTEVLDYCRLSNIDVSASCVVSRTIAGAKPVDVMDLPLSDNENDGWLDFINGLSPRQMREIMTAAKKS